MEGAGRKLFIETYGCQMNVGDTEIVVSLMQREGYVYTDRIGEADVILINTCSIRDNAEQRIWGRLAEMKRYRRANPGLVVGVIGCMAERLREKLKLYGGVDGSGRAFDSTVLKLALEELCAEAGVQLLYHTFISDVLVENGVVKAVVAGNKSGTVVIAGDMFIDCTGDGDVSVLAGAQYAKGNPETGKNQPISLRYVVGGVDLTALGEFFKSELARTGVNHACSYTPPYSVYASVCGDGSTLSELFKKAIDAGDLTVEDHLYWQMFNIPGRNDCIAFNNPEFFDDTDGTDPDTLTKTQIAGKKAIYRQLAFYKKYMKGFENAYIADIAAMVGIRESRNIITEYVLSAEDLLARRKFDDAFCQSNYPVDIHGKTLDFASRGEPVDDGRPYYEIPYGSLVVKGFDNLLVAGRCLGAEFLAQSSLRIMPCCRSAGEAAGIAAALALDGKMPARDVDGRKVRKIMEDRGAVYAEV